MQHLPRFTAKLQDFRARDIKIAMNGNDREAAFAKMMRNRLLKQADGTGIESRRRLIQQPDRALGREKTRKAEPASLPLRKMRRPIIGKMQKIKTFERRFGDFEVRRAIVIALPKTHILDNG